MKHDVLGFQIKVDDSLAVDVLEAGEDLADDGFGLVLGEE